MKINVSFFYKETSHVMQDSTDGKPLLHQGIDPGAAAIYHRAGTPASRTLIDHCLPSRAERYSQHVEIDIVNLHVLKATPSVKMFLQVFFLKTIP